MYFLHDLYYEAGLASNRWARNPMPCPTQERLLHFWHHNCGTDWDELNVTGNDMFRWRMPFFNGLDDDGNPLYRYECHEHTRRYYVTDEHGRRIDPRGWGKPIAPIPWKYRGLWLYDPGSKHNRRRSRGPAMWRGTARQAQIHGPVEDADGNVVAVLPPMRDGVALPFDVQDDAYDKRWCRRGSKSWKANPAARRQHQRHSKRGLAARAKADRADPVWERLAADGFPVSPAALAA